MSEPGPTSDQPKGHRRPWLLALPVVFGGMLAVIGVGMLVGVAVYLRHSSATPPTPRPLKEWTAHLSPWASLTYSKARGLTPDSGHQHARFAVVGLSGCKQLELAFRPRSPHPLQSVTCHGTFERPRVKRLFDQLNRELVKSSTVARNERGSSESWTTYRTNQAVTVTAAWRGKPLLAEPTELFSTIAVSRDCPKSMTRAICDRDFNHGIERMLELVSLP